MTVATNPIPMVFHNLPPSTLALPPVTTEAHGDGTATGTFCAFTDADDGACGSALLAPPT